MELHEIKSKVEEVTGLTVLNENDGVSVLVTGDQPEMVSVVASRLHEAGISFKQSKHRKFKGACFLVPLRNVGTAFAADWEFA